jgi:hypothetical protein
MREQLEQLGDLVYFDLNGDNPETLIIIHSFNGNISTLLSVISGGEIKNISFSDNTVKVEVLF